MRELLKKGVLFLDKYTTAILLVVVVATELYHSHKGGGHFSISINLNSFYLGMLFSVWVVYLTRTYVRIKNKSK